MKWFFKAWKRLRRSRGWARRGSPTMEYVIIIAVGALFTGLLYMTISDGKGLIQSAMEEKVREIIQGQLPEGNVPPGNTSGLAIPSVGIRRQTVLLMSVFLRSWAVPTDSAQLRVCPRQQAVPLLPAPGARRGIQHPAVILPPLHPKRSPEKKAGFPACGTKRKTMWPPDKS